ncbi:penicillin-binding transpeptidase domain-containing protein [Flavobacterium sp.]|uniref:penicillin-binding transpeptidase domain-containing protein n=1 Tax=Flavobacterium sp. TaxID=239 RepID=UPI003C3E2B00
MNKRTILLFFILIFNYALSAQTNLDRTFNKYGFEGSVTILDYNKSKWFFTDSIDANRATLPASTFKIINSLIAIEEKVIQDENEVLKWDGIKRSIFGKEVPNWNKDTDLKTAYKNSTIWFYVRIAERIGRKKYYRYLKKCQYGNLDFSEKGTDFWNYGEFRITPKNQMEFLVLLYENKLPFSQKTMDTVKEIMISENTDGHIFRDKTGWTTKDGIDIGWWVGYVETPDNIFFFATRIKKGVNENNPDFSKARKEITKAILKDLVAIQN